MPDKDQDYDYSYKDHDSVYDYDYTRKPIWRVAIALGCLAIIAVAVVLLSK